MANRNFYPGGKSLSREIVKLYGTLTIGASGAITAQSCKGFSVALTDSEAGRYTVTLEDAYTAFKGCAVTVEGAADAALTAFYAAVRGVDVSATAKSFLVQFVSVIETDTDLASGDKVHLEITLQNGSDV
jgi:hypothetical protein